MAGRKQIDESTRYYLDEIVKYLCNNYHPHTKFIVECDWRELVEWLENQKIFNHIKD